MIILQPAYNRKLAANNDVPIPEWRLPPVIVGGVSFAIGEYLPHPSFPISLFFYHF